MVAAVVERGGDGLVTGARVVVGACSEVPQRLPAVEARLLGHALTAQSVEDVVPADLAHLAPIDDVRGTAAYRREAALVLVRRMLTELVESPA